MAERSVDIALEAGRIATAVRALLVARSLPRNLDRRNATCAHKAMSTLRSAIALQGAGFAAADHFGSHFSFQASGALAFLSHETAFVRSVSSRLEICGSIIWSKAPCCLAELLIFRM